MDNYIKTIINGLKAWVENDISVLAEKTNASFASNSEDISTARNRLAGERTYDIFRSEKADYRNENVAYWNYLSSPTHPLIITPQSGIFWRNTWMRPVLSEDGSRIGYGNLALLKKTSYNDYMYFERCPDTGEACALVYRIAEQSITGVVPVNDTSTFGNLVITDYNECMASVIPLEQHMTLFSPNGAKYKITVSDDGTLTATEVTT